MLRLKVNIFYILITTFIYIIFFCFAEEGEGGEEEGEQEGA
jgi:hypothetical protein